MCSLPAVLALAPGDALELDPGNVLQGEAADLTNRSADGRRADGSDVMQKRINSKSREEYRTSALGFTAVRFTVYLKVYEDESKAL